MDNKTWINCCDIKKHSRWLKHLKHTKESLLISTNATEIYNMCIKFLISVQDVVFDNV